MPDDDPAHQHEPPIGSRGHLPALAPTTGVNHPHPEHGSDLSSVSAQGIDLHRVQLQGVSFHSADLKRGNLSRASTQATVFTKADLREASLELTRSLDQAVWKDTICPNGKVNPGPNPCKR